MAVNVRSKKQEGAKKSKSQVFNPGTGNFIKRDAKTGKFIEVKSDGKPFKGVSIEHGTVKVKSILSVKKTTALKAEQAVIKYRNALAS